MTPAEWKRAQQHLAAARETLKEADVLVGLGSPRGAVNRLYYACFYAVSALLASAGLSSKKHSGVKSLFHQYWIRPRELPVEMGDFYEVMFDRRQGGDYAAVTYTQHDVESWLAETKSFVERIETYLQEHPEGAS